MKPNLVMNKVVTLIFHLTQLAPMIQSSQGLRRSVTHDEIESPPDIIQAFQASECVLPREIEGAE